VRRRRSSPSTGTGSAPLASAGLDGLVEHIVSADDVHHPKRAPDMYRAACTLLHADPVRSVAFEDSATGVASARAAGMYVIGVPSLPHVTLDVDAGFGSLTDPALTDWAVTAPAGQ
jgi:beta-phosphoglucomutase-like phosphatase (HAD superfamily)